MIRIIDKPDSGKTKRLLEECSKVNGYVLCAHPERVLDKCKTYGLDPSTITAFGYTEIEPEVLDRPVFIDEIEKYLVAKHVSGYAMTKE